MNSFAKVMLNMSSIESESKTKSVNTSRNLHSTKNKMERAGHTDEYFKDAAKEVKLLENTKKFTAQARQLCTKYLGSMITKLTTVEKAMDQTIERYDKLFPSVPLIASTRAESIATIDSVNEKIKSATTKRQLMSGGWASQQDLMNDLSQTKGRSSFQPFKMNLSINGEDRDVTILTETTELSRFSMSAKEGPDKVKGRIVKTENGELNAIQDSQIISHLRSQAERMELDPSHVFPFANRNTCASNGHHHARESIMTIEGSSTTHHHHQATTPSIKPQSFDLPVCAFTHLGCNVLHSTDFTERHNHTVHNLAESRQSMYRSDPMRAIEPTQVFFSSTTRRDNKGNFELPFRVSSPPAESFCFDQTHFKKTEDAPGQVSSPPTKNDQIQDFQKFPQVTPERKETHEENDDSSCVLQKPKQKHSLSESLTPDFPFFPAEMDESLDNFFQSVLGRKELTISTAAECDDEDKKRDSVYTPSDPGQNSFGQDDYFAPTLEQKISSDEQKHNDHTNIASRENTNITGLETNAKTAPEADEQNVNTAGEQSVSMANEREEKAPPKKSIGKTRKNLEDFAATTPKRKGKKRGRPPKGQTQQTGKRRGRPPKRQTQQTGKSRLCRGCHDKCSRHKGSLCGSCYLATQKANNPEQKIM